MSRRTWRRVPDAPSSCTGKDPAGSWVQVDHTGDRRCAAIDGGRRAEAPHRLLQHPAAVTARTQCRSSNLRALLSARIQAAEPRPSPAQPSAPCSRVRQQRLDRPWHRLGPRRTSSHPLHALTAQHRVHNSLELGVAVRPPPHHEIPPGQRPPPPAARGGRGRGLRRPIEGAIDLEGITACASSYRRVDAPPAPLRGLRSGAAGPAQLRGAPHDAEPVANSATGPRGWPRTQRTVGRSSARGSVGVRLLLSPAITYRLGAVAQTGCVFKRPTRLGRRTTRRKLRGRPRWVRVLQPRPRAGIGRRSSPYNATSPLVWFRHQTLRLYWPPTSNRAWLIWPREATRAAHMRASKTLPPFIAARCSSRRAAGASTR
jgi:hypothetical protein